MIENLQDPIFPKPRDLPTPPRPTKTQEIIHAKQITNYVKHTEELLTNKGITYSLVWGQCTKAMPRKLKGFQSFNDIHHATNIVELLKLIWGIMHRSDGENYHYVTLYQALKRAFNVFQGCESQMPRSSSNPKTHLGWRYNTEWRSGLIQGQ